MIKKIKYAIKLFPVLLAIKNWPTALMLLFFPAEKIIYFKDGARFRVSSFLDILIIKEIYLDKEYLVKISAPKVIIDIGANIGTASIFFSKKYPNAKVLSFEPVKKTFNYLSENLILNSAANVIPFNLGVGGRKGKRTLFANSRSGLSSLYMKNGDITKTTVFTITMNDVFNKNMISRCDLLKMDCEGAEYEILFYTPDSVLDKISNIVLEYHDGLTKFTHEDLLTFLRLKKFKTDLKKHAIEPNIGIIYASR